MITASSNITREASAARLSSSTVYRPEWRICKPSWWPTTHSPSARRICNDSDTGAPAASYTAYSAISIRWLAIGFARDDLVRAISETQALHEKQPVFDGPNDPRHAPAVRSDPDAGYRWQGETFRGSDGLPQPLRPCSYGSGQLIESV